MCRGSEGGGTEEEPEDEACDVGAAAAWLGPATGVAGGAAGAGGGGGCFLKRPKTIVSSVKDEKMPKRCAQR